MRKAEVSIIISVFEQLEYTKRCLEALEHSLSGIIEYEVLIIDDCSEDGTVDFLKKLKYPYRIFFNSIQKGFAKNNNLAASQATGRYLCFLNNDVFVEGDWLLPMINVFKEKEGVGVVGNVQKLAFSNRFDHIMSNLQNVINNTVRSKSNIIDADFSSETTQLTRRSVVQQGATSMLAQANSQKNLVLSLFQQ